MDGEPADGSMETAANDPPSPMTDGGGQPDLGAKRLLLERAVEAWKGQLVDLGGRNTLLYYKDLRAGTLDLSAAPADALAALLDHRAVSLGRLVGSPEDLPSAARRARTVAAKGRENFEERGLRTMFLTWGMATWSNTRGTAVPAAPLLLAELSLSPRGCAADDFELAITDDWDVNPTLLRLLETDHAVRLDADRLDEIAATAGTSAAVDAIDSAAAGSVPGWSVSQRVVVGNFSYAKLPLVRDLEEALETGELDNHELLSAIAGDIDARRALRDRHPQVELGDTNFTPPKDEFLVLDADASQSFVINSAIKGADLVVEGPPGTGKSQTIANLIASMAARGQRVLFVAEKRAAIDAVLERLRNVGLGDLVLDLHGGAGSRKALAQQLARSLDAASRTPLPDVAELHARLARRRDELTAHTDAVHRSRAPWEVSFFGAESAVLDVPSSCHVDTRFQPTELSSLDRESFDAARVELDRFTTLGGLDLLAGKGPWAPALQQRTVGTSANAQQALASAAQLRDQTLPNTVGWIDYVVRYCGLSSPSTVAAWAETLALLDQLELTLQQLDPGVFQAELVGSTLADLAAALSAGAEGGFGGAMARRWNKEVRRAKRELTPFWLSGKAKARELHTSIVAAADQQARWATLSTDGGLPRLPEQLVGAKGAYQQLGLELRALGAWAGTSGLEGLSSTEVRTRVDALASDNATLSRLPELNELRSRLEARGLSALLVEIAPRQLDPDQAVSALDHAWHMSIVECLTLDDPVIAGFDGRAHRRAVEDFQQADRAHVRSGPERIRRAVAERAVALRDQHPEAAGLVEKEARKKQRHIPVRDLFHAAPQILTGLKPCWAMSPLVVAQLLPVERCFDVVIFDEASQVTPADAVGALLRAERAIVAGDTRQLPPTTFFASQSTVDVDAHQLGDSELSESLGLVDDMESVLDVMGALLPPPHGTRTLGWHYRSRDERLIAFSNAQRSLYDWSLTTFPGVSGGACPTHMLVVAEAGTDGSSSSAEVEAVVDLMLDHARTRPDLSLGVIAMGIKHADRISETLRLARRGHPELDRYFEYGPEDGSAPEPVFVKNLERVQGDERDAIILTVGYGKGPDGRMQYRFGPLNQEGGERRLNVAITRARQMMTVVSSFSADEMDPDRLHAEGAKMLGRYLAYAESGGKDLGQIPRDHAPLNPFERDVQRHLTEAGISMIPQLGASGYWIDFAAQHPTRPGQMILAIECDGASYHSSPTARDRDRLRQDHLERLGWTFHRIWSTDWFRNREQEVERAKAVYDAAVVRTDQERANGLNSTTHAPARSLEEPLGPGASHAAPTRPGRRPAIRRGLAITDYRWADLVALARWIETDTLLRTEDELFNELMRELGFKKRGSRIVSALEAAIKAARTQ